MADSIGPALPPALLAKRRQQQQQQQQAGKEEEERAPTTATAARVVGPQLPPGFGKADSTATSTPAPASAPAVAGPALPPGFVRRRDTDTEEAERRQPVAGPVRPGSIGPALPPGLSGAAAAAAAAEEPEPEQDDPYVLGPMPAAPGGDEGLYDTVRLIEERSKRMKEQLTAPEEKAKARDSWMTVLPERVNKNFGTGARTFRKTNNTSTGEGRDEWTMTPAEKAELARSGKQAKAQQSREEQERALTDRELKLRKQIDSYTAESRGQSLMDKHAKKRKKDKKKQEDKGELKRQRFDREKEMAVSQLDPEKRGNLIQTLSRYQNKFTTGRFL